MEIITLVLVLLLLVVISGYIGRILPWPVPLPLVQIGLGALVAAFTRFNVTLEPDIFFLLFLPPLLFLDGWRIPKSSLVEDRRMILELALGLVVFTVLGIGYVTHWMIPVIPLPVAFALAAVLSPTDPVAVSAITARVPLPKRMMRILEGESLLNDASGLVCLRFAIAATLTGQFALSDAILTFLWLSVGGVLVGILLTQSIGLSKNWLYKRLGEESGTQVLISLLIPFGAYLIAEQLKCSGILAAVSAGMTMGYLETSGRAMATTRVRRTIVWDTLQFAVNGIIFVLLGEQLPTIFKGAVRVVNELGHQSAWWLLPYVVAITFGLVFLRFLWVWVSVRIRPFGLFPACSDIRTLHWRLVAGMSLAGVRGAVTLAGILTLPLIMPNGQGFPARDLAIFLAAAVIILSLLLASLTLPRLIDGLHLAPEPAENPAESIARVAAAKAAIRAVEQAQYKMTINQSDADVYRLAATHVMSVYRHAIEEESKEGEEKDRLEQLDNVEKSLHLVALKASREEIFRLARIRQLDHDIMRKLVREIDLMEARYSS